MEDLAEGMVVLDLADMIAETVPVLRGVSGWMSGSSAMDTTDDRVLRECSETVCRVSRGVYKGMLSLSWKTHCYENKDIQHRQAHSEITDSKPVEDVRQWDDMDYNVQV